MYELKVKQCQFPLVSQSSEQHGIDRDTFPLAVKAGSYNWVEIALLLFHDITS